MGSSKEQQSVIYTGIPDKITGAFKKYERLTRPLQPPSELLYSIQGIIKSLLVTCLSWAPSVTEGSRSLNQCSSTIWFDCFCLHGLITSLLGKKHCWKEAVSFLYYSCCFLCPSLSSSSFLIFLYSTTEWIKLGCLRLAGPWQAMNKSPRQQHLVLNSSVAAVCVAGFPWPTERSSTMFCVFPCPWWVISLFRLSQLLMSCCNSL